MIKVAIVSVLSVILIQILKSYRTEYALLIKISTIFIIGFFIINEFNKRAIVFSFLSDIDTASVSYLPVLLKTLGIVIITQIASNICHDSGEEALSTVTELVGKIMILIICLPLIEALYSLIKGYLEY